MTDLTKPWLPRRSIEVDECKNCGETRNVELCISKDDEGYWVAYDQAVEILAQALKERDEARTALETARMKLRIVRGATRDEHLLTILGDEE